MDELIKRYASDKQCRPLALELRRLVAPGTRSGSTIYQRSAVEADYEGYEEWIRRDGTMQRLITEREAEELLWAGWPEAFSSDEIYSRAVSHRMVA